MSNDIISLEEFVATRKLVPAHKFMGAKSYTPEELKGLKFMVYNPEQIQLKNGKLWSGLYIEVYDNDKYCVPLTHSHKFFDDLASAEEYIYTMRKLQHDAK